MKYFCTDCKHTPFISSGKIKIREMLCKMPSDAGFSYVYGEHMIDIDGCEIKNKTGDCTDYSPLDFNDRIDFIINKHKLSLKKKIDLIFTDIKNSYYGLYLTKVVNVTDLSFSEQDNFDNFRNTMINHIAKRCNIPKKILGIK